MKDDPLYCELPDGFEPPSSPRDPAATPSRGYAWGVATATLIWLGGELASLGFIVPRFAGVFRQVKVELPQLTIAVIWSSWVVCRIPWIFVGLALAFSVWTGVWEEKARRALRMVLPPAICLTAGVLVVALFMPMTGLLEGIGRRR